MNPFSRWILSRGARADAKHGQSSVEERLLVELGPRPKFDTDNNTRHAEFARSRSNQAEVQELREDIVRAEDEATRQVSPRLFAVWLVVALVVEFFGATVVLEVMGVTERERLPLSLALAFAILGITWLAAERTAPKSGEDGRQGVLQGMKRSVVTVIVLGIYTIVVVSIAIVRMASSSADDVAPVEALGRTVIMVITTVGPCWFAEWLIRRRSPALALQKRLGVLRARLADAVRARTQAEKAMDQIARDTERWDREYTRRKALYEIEHRLELARARQGEA